MFILSLNPANMLYILISSIRFFVDCRIFYIGKSCHLQQREIYFFFPNLYAVYFVLFCFCFIVLRRTFSTILNKIGKSQHLASFWILAWKYLVSYHLLAVLFFSDIICQNEEVLLFIWIFYFELILGFLKCFTCIYEHNYDHFSLWSVDVMG